MPRFIIPLLALLITALTAGTAFADNAVRFPDADWSPALLKRIEDGPSILPRDFVTGVVPPSANDSAETRADLDGMLAMQDDERTPDQLSKIFQENREDHNHPGQIFANNGLLDIKTHPHTAKLVWTIIKDVDFFILREKRTYERARPTQLEPRLKALIAIPPHASYPSGHAGQNFAVALLLSALDPQNKDAYEELGIAVGHRREIAGVHYPSDSEAGRTLARTVVAALMKEDKLAELIKLSRAEFKSE